MDAQVAFEKVMKGRYGEKIADQQTQTPILNHINEMNSSPKMEFKIYDEEEICLADGNNDSDASKLSRNSKCSKLLKTDVVL